MSSEKKRLLLLATVSVDTDLANSAVYLLLSLDQFQLYIVVHTERRRTANANVYYRPKLREGNVFMPVCQSFCSQGREGGLPDGDPPSRERPP